MLRHDLYRFVALNFGELYETSALRDGDHVRDELGLANRSWELFRPFSCVFEWLDVPLEDRQAAVDYFRQSLASTSAELPAETETVLRVLARLAEETDEELRLLSPLLLAEVNAELDEDRRIDAAQLGVILSDFGLVRSKRRQRARRRRVMEWVIHHGRLHRALERWRPVTDGDMPDTAGQDGDDEAMSSDGVPMAQETNRGSPR